MQLARHVNQLSQTTKLFTKCSSRMRVRSCSGQWLQPPPPLSTTRERHTKHSNLVHLASPSSWSAAPLLLKAYTSRAESPQISGTSSLHQAISNESSWEGSCEVLLQMLNDVALKSAESLDESTISTSTSSSSLQQAIKLLENLVLVQQQQPPSASLKPETALLPLHWILAVWSGEMRKPSRQIIDPVLRTLTPQLLLRWIDLLTDTLNVLPSRITYRYLMDADLSNSAFILQVFQRMLDSHSSELSPTVDDFHRVMHTLISNHQLEQAEACIQTLLLLHRNARGVVAFRPTLRTYTIVIAGYAKAGRPRDATRVLQQLIDDGIVVPSNATFETCLNAWAASPRKAAGHQAEELVLQMQRLGLKPSRSSLVKVISAWVQTRQASGPARARTILELLVSLDDGNDKAVVDSHLHVIRAYAYAASNDRAAPDHCQSLLTTLLQSKIPVPQASLRKLFALTILSWARSRRADALAQVEQLLTEMTRDYKVSPDMFVYNCVLEAHAGRGDSIGALRLWKQLYSEFIQGHPTIQPDTKSVNSVLLALNRSRHPGKVAEAEEFWKFARKSSISPDVTTFNALLSILGKSTCVDTARKGETYLHECEQLFKSGDKSCRPSVVTYTKAIELWMNLALPESVKFAHKHWASLRRQVRTPPEAAFSAFLAVLDRNGHHEEAEKLRLNMARGV